MKQRIFIGSSTEGLKKAHQIRDLLVALGDIEPLLWTDLFEPGLLTFEALENMLQQCCAAVFIASPDNESAIRGETVKTPNPNILLEFGLVAGRAGRHNIALCVFGGVSLPSDLKGLTVIDMDAPPAPPGLGTARLELPIEKLRSWASTLLTTTGMIARTDIVHGYTGRWTFELQLDHWRSIAISAPHYVYVKGTFTVVIPANGQAGTGMAQGRMYFSLGVEREGTTGSYQGEYRTAHEITTVACERDGALCFTSQAFAVEKISASGPPPEVLAGLDTAEPWSAEWRLNPSAGPRNLEGTVSTDSTIGTHGKAKVVRL